MSWAPLWIDASKVDLQFGIASSTVITLIAYRFLLANLLPKLPYLTRLDYLTLSGTILVFASFLEVLVTSLFTAATRRGVTKRIDFWCRLAFPVAFIASLAWLLCV